MKVKDSVFFTVQAWMVTKLNLRGVERDVFAIIYGFSQDEQSKCYDSLNYMAELIGCTKQAVINAINSLLEKNYIKKEQSSDISDMRNRYTYNVRTVTSIVEGWSTEFTGGGQLSLPANDESGQLSLPHKRNIKTNTLRESIGEADGTHSKQSRSHKKVYRPTETLSDELGESMPVAPEEKKKQKRESKRYRQEDIDTAIIQFTDDIQLQEELRAYASVIRSEDFGVKRLKNGDQFRGYLRQLKECAKNPNDPKELFKIVEYSLLHSYLGFYRLDDRKGRSDNKPTKDNLISQTIFGDDVKEELRRRAERNGVFN